MFEISELSLKGFRKFSDNTFQFKPGLNVIVGKTCSGKSSVIDACHCLLAPLMSYLGTQERNSGLKQEDETVDEKEFIGSQCGRTDISLVLNCFDKTRTLSRGRSSFDNDIRTKNNSQYRILGGKLEKLCIDFNNAIRNDEPYPIMPVLAYYSNDRFILSDWMNTKWFDNKAAARETLIELGYIDALKKKTDFNMTFNEIYALSVQSYVEKQFVKEGLKSNPAYERRLNKLGDVFRKAFRVFFSTITISDFAWFPVKDDLAIRYNGHNYYLNSFVPYVISNTMMVVDLTRRIFELYGENESFNRAEGIVLIDDIVDCRLLNERHIAVFLALLTELFPKIQFIVTANQGLNDMYSVLRELTQEEDRVNVIELE